MAEYETQHADVWTIGTEVRVGTGRDIPGEITAVMIRGEGITYEVTWWDGRNCCTRWFERWEVEAANGTLPRRIGFSQPAAKPAGCACDRPYCESVRARG